MGNIARMKPVYMVPEDYINQLQRQYPSYGILRNHISKVLQNREQRQADPHELGTDFPSAGVLLALVLPQAVVENGLDPISHLHIIYEKRSEKLKSHPGQMAFPGGTMEDVDQDARDAAFREAEEEVGINPNDLEFISYLDEFVAISNVLVHPVVAWLIEDVPLENFSQAIAEKYRPRTEESTATVVMPLTHLLNPRYYRHQPYSRNGSQVGWIRYFDTAEIRPNDNIGGLTASMTRRFIDEVFTDNLLPEEKIS